MAKYKKKKSHTSSDISSSGSVSTSRKKSTAASAKVPEVKTRKNKTTKKRSKKKSSVKRRNQTDASVRSKHVKEEILQGQQGHGNYFKYDVKAFKVSDEELRSMAKLANDRLYKLEKSGVSEYSREYKTVEHYAVGDPNGKGFIYNVNEEAGRIRFRTSDKGMTPQERSYYINTLRNFIRAETSTIRGTKKAMKRAYNTFMSNNGKLVPDMTEEQYRNLWKTYRESALPDKIGHKGYSAAFVELIKNTNIYTLSQDQLEQSLDYLATASDIYHSTVGQVDSVLDRVTDLEWIGNP